MSNKIVEIDGKRYRVVPFPSTADYLDRSAVAEQRAKDALRQSRRALPQAAEGESQTCSVCGQKGHNKRTCTG